ncbi:nuclear transport factor 2 family protein [Rhizobium sp. FY34]|uniref:nuclear transport factor 2 family protein n=1 Tax=Rhizobium sp. FY34 TaxID=2562309 RepID=UPI0010BFFC89|nr:nuclear transport factor 2 family protein [Rhizobium sp. FY34]
MTPPNAGDAEALVVGPVARQLEAYNARDIDAFMRCWHEDCLYYAFPNEILAAGADDIRARHIERFREPDLHGRLLSRIVLGNLVIDHETVTRNYPQGRGEVDVVCLYEVENGLICKAWFKLGQPRMAEDEKA